MLISIDVRLIRICAANREGKLWLRKNLQDKKHSENSSSKFSTLHPPNHFMSTHKIENNYIKYMAARTRSASISFAFAMQLNYALCFVVGYFIYCKIIRSDSI